MTAGLAKNNMWCSHLGVPYSPVDFWPPWDISLPDSSRGGGNAKFDRTRGSCVEELKAKDKLLEFTEQRFRSGTEREEWLLKTRHDY